MVIEMPNQIFINMLGKGDNIIGKPLAEALPELKSENQPFLQILNDVYTSGNPFQISGVQAKIVKNGVMTTGYYDVSYTPIFGTCYFERGN